MISQTQRRSADRNFCCGHPIQKFSNAQIKDRLHVELKVPIMQRSDIVVKDYLESNASYKHHRNRIMNGRTIIAAAIAAMILLSLTACGKVPPTSNSDQGHSAAGNAGGTVEIIPSTDTDGSSDADTTESKDTPANEDGAADDAWKAAFEKSLLENYGVKPDHYEELENGVYQVYVEIDGKVVPYVVVDSATGDYHG